MPDKETSTYDFYESECRARTMGAKYVTIYARDGKIPIHLVTKKTRVLHYIGDDGSIPFEIFKRAPKVEQIHLEECTQISSEEMMYVRQCCPCLKIFTQDMTYEHVPFLNHPLYGSYTFTDKGSIKYEFFK